MLFLSLSDYSKGISEVLGKFVANIAKRCSTDVYVFMSFLCTGSGSGSLARNGLLPLAG